jgi:hypothetical protein
MADHNQFSHQTIEIHRRSVDGRSRDKKTDVSYEKSKIVLHFYIENNLDQIRGQLIRF